ncbi:hypothetical protein AAC387_Pa05g0659 [Persea americana]
MDFFEPLISPVVECIGRSCATVAQQIGYIKNLARNFEKLNEEARTLFDKKEDTEHEIKRDGNKIPTNQCRSWLDKVNEIQYQVNSIKEEYSKGDNRCLSRWCLNVPSSWKLGRRIVLTTDAVLDLCKKAKFDGGVVVDALPPTLETKPVLTIEEGTSTKHTLQKILNSVRDPIKHKIGAALRKEDNVHVWENAVQELSSPNTSDIHDRLFKRLQFSVDRLENDDFCSLVVCRLSCQLASTAF